MNRQNILIGLFFMAALVASRFLPWAPNFSPVYAVLLVAASVMQPRWWCVAFCALGIFLTDIAIGFYSGMTFVYLGYAAILATGFRAKTLEGGRIDWVRLGVGSVAANVVFFFLSNFGVWLDGIIYPRTAQGLYECYVMALPFFEQSVLSTFVFAVVFFKLAQAVPMLFPVRATNGPN